MSHQPVVSVCIPAYNNARFIAATLESVLNQNHANFEVILTDDRSVDQTVSVVKTFSDGRIKLVQNGSNLGLGENWNKALSLAKGEYIKMMGADDLLYPDCLALQVQALEAPSNSTAVLAVCNSDVINSHGDVVLRRRSRFGHGQVSGGRLIRSCVRWGANLIGEPVVGLFRRDVLKRSGMFDSSNPYMIDLAFWAELLKHGTAVMDRRRLAAFRISASSVSARLGLKQVAYTRSIIQKLHADPAYRTSRLDALCGSFFAYPRCLLRNCLIAMRGR